MKTIPKCYVHVTTEEDFKKVTEIMKKYGCELVDFNSRNMKNYLNNKSQLVINFNHPNNLLDWSYCNMEYYGLNPDDPLLISSKQFIEQVDDFSIDSKIKELKMILNL